MRPLTALLALLASTSALAIQPETAGFIGIEPHRVFRENPRVQARLAAQPEWRAFIGAHPDWIARFDEVTGAPFRLRGGPIPVPTDSEEAVVKGIIEVLEPHAKLLRFAPGTLELGSASYNERLDTWYVDLDVPRDGVPVYRGGITARVKHGNLVLIGALAYGDQPTVGSWTLDTDSAISRAIQDGPAAHVKHDEASAERIWLPLLDADGLRLRATWQVRTRTHEVPGKWVTFVDAESGELLSVHNEVRFIDGTVSGLHAERTPDGSPLVHTPFPEAVVSEGTDVAVTDELGAFSLPDAPSYVTTLHGPYLEVVNTDGPEGELVGAGPDLVWTTDSATQAEISTWAYLHQIRAWGLDVAPEVGMVQGPITSNVNITNESCNAFFDGEVNFYAAADGCANTGEIADVNYHEWGHGFHAWSIESQLYGFDGSLSEGAADTVAFLQTGDSRIAPHFFVGGGAIRDVAPDRVYPADYVNDQQYVHSNGLIFGGAMWDLWHLLMDLEGEAQGTESTEHIFAGLLKGGPDIAASFEEALLADDDDGDLANGTPHECAIIDAFGAHGLGPLGGSGVYLATHTPQKLHLEADKPYPVEIDVRSSAPNCFDIDPVGGTVHYRVGGKGAWKSAPLAAAGTLVSGEIPALERGSFVEYWAEVDDASGSSTVLPAGGEITPFGFFVGGAIEVFCNDFERGRGQFKHDLVAGEDGDGADDWQWGAPAGVGGDPSAAASGSKVWGNDLGWDGYNGEYQNDKHNRLTSPTLDTAHYTGVFLSYQRWLNIEDAVFDRAEILADGERVWSNVSGTANVGGKDHLDREWTPQAIDLQGAGDDGSVTLEWSMASDGGLTFGGWTIDDVCLLAPDTPDNRLGINHFRAARGDDAVALAWTNPLHDPVRSVFVIRNDSHMPTSPSDGVVIWTSDDIELGAQEGFVDRSAHKWDAWYAAYAIDDANVLSWTREGFNAAFVPGEGPAPGRITGEGAACGCASAAPAGGWLGLVGLGLLGMRRRE